MAEPVDLDKAIQQITDILGRDSLPDNLVQLISSIAERKDSEHQRTNCETHSTAAAKNILERLHKNSDPRVTLLHSIKQFVRPARKGYIDKCIKILNFIEVSKLIEANPEK